MIKIQPSPQEPKIRLSIKSKKKVPRRSTGSTYPSEGSPQSPQPGPSQKVTEFSLNPPLPTACLSPRHDIPLSPRYCNQMTPNRFCFQHMTAFISSIKNQPTPANSSAKRDLDLHCQMLAGVDRKEGENKSSEMWHQCGGEEKARGSIQFWFCSEEEQVKHDKFRRKGIVPVKGRALVQS